MVDDDDDDDDDSIAAEENHVLFVFFANWPAFDGVMDATVFDGELAV